MNAILNYPGAKWSMAEQIVSIMPPHKSYLEPFFGSGAVLFNKPPSAIETVNDLDGDIVNFFKVLREQTSELIEAISLTRMRVKYLTMLTKTVGYRILIRHTVLQSDREWDTALKPIKKRDLR